MPPPTYVQDRPSDDRGTYRLYGLRPGAYVVSAGGASLGGMRSTVYTGDGQVFHPSSTREAASEVRVGPGEEASGIDIRYRAISTYTVAGVLEGVPAESSWTNVRLAYAADGAMVASAAATSEGGAWRFTLTGVPDGEYDVTASAYGGSRAQGVSESRRVVVRGADVTGVELRVEPLASVEGRIVWEEPLVAGCPKEANGPVRDAVVGFRRHDPTKPTQPVLGATDVRGGFAATDMRAGDYYPVANLVDDRWYLASVLREREKGRPSDAAAGIPLKLGERVSGVVFTFRTGAASLAGRVAGPKGAAPRATYTLVLVPAEPDAADVLTRYYGAAVASDGSFEAKHVAPGRYWLLLKAEGADWFAPEQVARTVADAPRRAALLAAARTAQNAVELKPCQRTREHVVPLNPPTTK